MDAASNPRTLEQLKELGAGRPAPADVARLYRQAFREFGTQALWSRRPSETPTIAQALVVAEGLRREGNLNSRSSVHAMPLSKIQRVSMNHARLVEAVLRNPTNRAILERLPALGLADAWLVSGAVFQTVWNVVTGRPPDFGIKDYDIFYFDPDTSFEAEDAVIRRVAACMSDVCDCAEARNQARVHLWYHEKFHAPYGPLHRTTDGIDRFLARVAQVGVQPMGDGCAVYAPHGLDDIATMTVRPNPCPNFRAEIYDAKATSWEMRWPEITILAATEV